MLLIKSKKIRPFEEKVLTSGLCDFSLPANFVTADGVKSAVYDSSGYTCLDDIIFKDTDDILELLEKTLMNLDKAGEFLIDPDHIVLDGNTVFQNLKNGDVKFAFIPLREQKHRGNVINIMDYFGNRADQDGRVIISKLKKYIIGRNLSMRDAVKHISLIRKDLKTEDIQA